MSTSGIVFFDSGRAYVVRKQDCKRPQFATLDALQRTPDDRRFLEQFESIFLAAARGDLACCQKVVEEGFTDFYAFSVGRFVLVSGECLDLVSPVAIAERNGHSDITQYFKEVLKKQADQRQEKQVFEAAANAFAAVSRQEKLLKDLEHILQSTAKATELISSPLSPDEQAEEFDRWRQERDSSVEISHSSSSEDESIDLKESSKPSEEEMRAMIKKHPVGTAHIHLAITQGYSSEIIEAMLTQAAQVKGFDSANLLYLLIENNYPDYLVLMAVNYASEIDFVCFDLAMKKDYLSLNTQHAIFLKSP